MKAILSIPGMTCGGCAQTVRSVLEDQAGMNEVQVNLRAQTVHVEFDAQQLGLEQVRDILNQHGYPVVETQEG